MTNEIALDLQLPQWTHLTIALLAAACSAGCMRPVPPEILSFEGPEQVGRDTAVVFTAQINEAATEPVRLFWDFGTGYEDRGLRVQHAFPNEGTYTVRFVAENEAGRAMRTWTLRVGNPPRNSTASPQIATVQVDPNPAHVGEHVRYETRVVGPTPTRYIWTFGDGSQSEAAAPFHAYEMPGVYEVRVWVEHATGEDVRTVQVEVEPNLPDYCLAPIEGTSVYFARNASVITNAAHRALRENALLFRNCTSLPISVEGRAAPQEQNAEALASDRAAAVAAFYRLAGVDSTRIRLAHRVVASRNGGKSPKGAEATAQSVQSILQRRDAAY